MSSFWQDKRVFVTGCAGFLGSWLTAALVSAGADVIGLIRDRVPQSQLVRSGTVQRIKIVEGDVSDYTLMERSLAEYEVGFIFHLAAQTIVGIANRAPLSTFETNVKGTWALLEAARRNPTVQGVVVASSDKAYGDQPELPYREEAPLQGRHPYDVSKSCADLIAQAYAHTYQMPLAVTRFANLYGGGDLNWNRIVPGTVRSVLRGERPVVRSDGTFKRDYLYVQDAVNGYLLLGERLADPAVCGQSFNFGLDRPATALEVVQTIIALSDYPDLEPVILNEAHNEIRDQYLASEKAHRFLGWQPDYTLEQGLEETMDWYMAFFTG
ncbi:MAG: GDP-mannose 4,6-dehydratase [Chloroflexi bacterium]|nr:GDP-mannose 4,6-dehydratase [Chloroflexota bacterium]MCI0644172.1 GDP-mannose 4,6-dehydratase [Chloroflexota bacterium]MCI0725245.1 GDP-mannose 4,6-dehydratase [Chloroflexota bacterium]